MKKLDFHIHTVPTISDSDFTFSMSKLSQYVEASRLDAIAITNHNVFDESQFRAISATLAIRVFPGIEINLEKCHLLLIADPGKISEFADSTAKVTKAIVAPTDYITVTDLNSFFGDLSGYLLIPHCEKKPAIEPYTLAAISKYVSAGEVDSAKKFVRAHKNPNALTPVLFSDVRISEVLSSFPTRHTYIDCGELTLPAIKSCLAHKNKVSLSAADGNRLFRIFDDGQMISTGLNVVLGERSSGKSFTLNRIAESIENVKYIRQFELVQQDEKVYEREFNSDLNRRRSTFVDGYLRGFKSVVEDVMTVDTVANGRDVEEYLATLMQSADEADRNDTYSATALFNETALTFSDDTTLKELIQSVRQLIENVDHREIISKHLDLLALRRLACELIELLWTKAAYKKRVGVVNGIIREVKDLLKIHSSATQVKDVDLFKVAIDQKKVNRFNEIVQTIRTDAIIYQDEVHNFKVVARKRPHSGAGEVKSASGTNAAFGPVMKVYGNPYDYLQELKNITALSRSELYRLFVYIGFEILNKHGAPVSGGERSEFRLLQEIKDAQNFDMLLIDEPESSFDNMFLCTAVNEILRAIADNMPVLVVTHNNTIGASIGADYVLCARKYVNGKDVSFKLYSGYPTDKTLCSTDGQSIPNHGAFMDCLEAGVNAYQSRRSLYEAIAD